MMHCRHTLLCVSTVRESGRGWFGRFLLSILVITAAAGLTIACGSGERTSPPLTGNTRVTVAVSSTANDQLFKYDLIFTSISLVNQKGMSVPLISGDMSTVELIHVNGGIEPLVTTTIPQDVYTAASVTIASATIGCAAHYPPTGGFLFDLSGHGSISNEITVNLPAPITVTGDSMGLVLNVQLSRSANFSCYDPNTPPTPITPIFELTPIVNMAAGKVLGLDGKITAINPEANSFTLAVTGGFEHIRTLPVSSAPGTVFQGLSSASALSVGTFVNLDGTIQPDGSVMAARIEVQDPAAINVVKGPLLYIPAALPWAAICDRLWWAADTSSVMGCGGRVDISNTAFAISGQATDLEKLPFVPVFNSNTLVAGQEVSISYTRGSTLPNIYETARTIMLRPQTIDGRVVNSAQAGDWTAYTVSLAPYSVFPVLASQPGQTVPTQPGVVQVYVDRNTQLLNKEALAPGSTFRFYGLIFYDNGTLRMDCLQVSDGVPQ